MIESTRATACQAAPAGVSVMGMKRVGMAAALTLLPMVAMGATVTLPPVSVGAGVRTSFTSTSSDAGFEAGDADDTNDFALDSVRLYLSGSATDVIKLTFNTEYTGSPPGGDNKVQVIDAIARFEFSPQFNIWAGRFLPPSDRANLCGPYYTNHWGVYVDGIQDGWPMVAAGRDNGVAYWGDFNRFKFSAGFFDVPSTTGDADPGTEADGGDVIFATRAQYNFWDIETGYYLNSTYYGGKDLFSIGVAYQGTSGDDAMSVDLLIEKKLGASGTVTFESEYAKYDGLGGYGFGGATESDGAYALLSYLFPQEVGIGKFQILGKFASATSDVAGDDLDKETTEFDLGYIMKEFNARLYLFVIDHNFDDGLGVDFTQTGIGLQVQI